MFGPIIRLSGGGCKVVTQLSHLTPNVLQNNIASHQYDIDDSSFHLRMTGHNRMSSDVVGSHRTSTDIVGQISVQ